VGFLLVNWDLGLYCYWITNLEEEGSMSLKVYNTLGRKKMKFSPLREGKVGMYVCGVTVYDYCHIGHARSALVFDMIYRYLKARGYDATYVRNFTDIDDKIINRANREGMDFREISEKFIQAFYEDMDALKAQPPDVEPRATEHIKEMMELVQGLVDKGHAYVVDGDVYFDVLSFPEYGKLSGRSLEDMRAGARIEVDDKKGNPLDFALWKASKPGEPAWDSPWGPGRPGWHIECSVMSMKYLGETLDIHGGGLDLIFPHHENEIAQSEAYTGKPFCLYWIHNGFVSVEGEKMSKSLGNVLLIQDMVKEYHPEVLRLFLLSTHYRSPIDFSRKGLEEAREAMNRLYRTLEAVEEVGVSEGKPTGGESMEVVAKLKEKREAFYNAMDDDFNSALALAKLFEGARGINRFLKESCESQEEKARVVGAFMDLVEPVKRVFGILEMAPQEWLTGRNEELPLPLEEIEGLIQDRQEARKRKDWARADTIRNELKAKGILLEDAPKGTIWRLA
jgi:cysteinyl-tRNA synthetase